MAGPMTGQSQSTPLGQTSPCRLALYAVRNMRAPAGVARVDLVQMGLEGLRTAAAKFSPDRGKFSVYATRWWVPG